MCFRRQIECSCGHFAIVRGICAVDYRITFRNAIATSTDDWRARDRIFASECNASVKEQRKMEEQERRRRKGIRQPRGEKFASSLCYLQNVSFIIHIIHCYFMRTIQFQTLLQFDCINVLQCNVI